MQRVLREEDLTLAEPLQPERLQKLVYRYCPPSIGNLFALPRVGNADALEWWTELAGQPRHFSELPADGQEALTQRLNQRLLALGNLIAELEKRGETAAADLRELPTSPDTSNLYAVNGEPLLIRWVPMLSASTPSHVYPTTSPQPSPTAIKPTPSAPLSPRRRWVIPLFLPLLVGLLLLGLWLAFTHWERFSLIWQRSEGETLPFACRNDDTPPPEFVTIFDTSGSMNLNIHTSMEDELWFYNMPDFLRELRANDPRIQRMMAEPSRLTVAQHAFSDLVQAIDPNVDIGLVTYQGCEATIVQGVFSAEQRPKLIEGVHRLAANDGTPLAASLLQAADMVDGKVRDAVILAFVDGADGCDQNQCAIAQDIASRQPRLRVNVVDISNSGLSNCIAEQTGGRVFGSQDAELISIMLKDAGRETLSEDYCNG
ncbi:VWA domain-containing protein [Vreelandella neptunia]|uniref:VWA domain-containing protein n=1 Tax=Vreelandella neptunia TaxID=115551 RepID=A0ABS9S937_9GAMM|nr:VWA domain-containing protein [Halomonas neptunia]MCH4812625.1 VWA domain-containing protein [Halomonas neptunia]